MQYTNEQLKRTLAKMLPDEVEMHDSVFGEKLFWNRAPVGGHRQLCEALDTELLHLCWLVEETLTIEQQITYLNNLYREPSVENNSKWRIHPDCHATFEQRTIALAQTLGIEIL